VRTIRNTQIHCVGRTPSFINTSKRVVYRHWTVNIILASPPRSSRWTFPHSNIVYTLLTSRALPHFTNFTTACDFITLQVPRYVMARLRMLRIDYIQTFSLTQNSPDFRFCSMTRDLDLFTRRDLLLIDRRNDSATGSFMVVSLQVSLRSSHHLLITCSLTQLRGSHRAPRYDTISVQTDTDPMIWQRMILTPHKSYKRRKENVQ
jgi:hypothetical protein